MPEQADETWTPIIDEFLFHLRTHLNTIKGYSDIMKLYLTAQDSDIHPEHQLTPEITLEMLSYIQDAVERLKQQHDTLNKKIYRQEIRTEDNIDV